MHVPFESLTFSVARELKLRDGFHSIIQRASAMLDGYSGENVLCRARTENTIQCGLALKGGVAQ